MMIDWKAIAPSRDDWEALRALFSEAGLPHTHWHNGVPIWNQPIDMDVVQQIADSYARGKKPKAVTVEYKIPEPKPEPTPEPKVEPKAKVEPVSLPKRGRGRPKKTK